MNTEQLTNLINQYNNSSEEYKVTSYWKEYEKNIIQTVYNMDIDQLRSGKYPILATFGFNDVIYTYHPNLNFFRKIILKFIHRYIIKNRNILPYGLNINNLREIAFLHCELIGQLSNAKPISELQVCNFGNPEDIFEIKGKKYTMQFLDYYLRYCFANKTIGFNGNEILVELGSGSGYQVEILKKLYPELTVLCFDLPAQIFLGEEYLSRAFSEKEIISSNSTCKWNNLSDLVKGGVHFFGNWQFPLLENFKFDVFWNAASFGEMEPNIVNNYLSFILGNVEWIYLLQAKYGKEKKGKNRVIEPITFDAYGSFLTDYVLIESHDAWQAIRKLKQSGGYFEGIWRIKK